jgi:hypothetical protein
MSRRAIFLRKIGRTPIGARTMSGYARSNDSTIPRAYSLSIMVSAARTGAKTVLKGVSRISRQRPWPIWSRSNHGDDRLRRFSRVRRGRSLSSECSRCAGVVTVMSEVHIMNRDRPVSRRCDGGLPLRSRLGPEFPKGSSGEEVALNIEVIVDGGMDAEKLLGGSC